MIIVRTPLRISFIGGGSDLPAFYNKAVGRVISTAIDKYVFIAINEKFDGKFRVSYSVTEIVERPEEIINSRVRAALQHFDVQHGLEIISIADVPSHGSGLGASSSFAVGLVHGLSRFLGRETHKDKKTLAETACHLELNVLKEESGKQDQYAAAYGGLNLMEFYPEKVVVIPVKVSQNKLEEFNSHLMIFYVGGSRSAAHNSAVLSKNLNYDEKRFLAQRQLAELAIPFSNKLVRGDFKTLGEILEEGWRLKKKTSSGISNRWIDQLYKTARQNGAWGGKLLGAGSGGFMLFMVPPQSQRKIRRAFSKFKELPVNFDSEGSKTIFNRYEARS